MKTRRLWPVPILFLLLAGPAFGAGSATLLRDIQPNGVSEHEQAGVESDLLSLGRAALLMVHEPSSGRELWGSDGTDAGTRPLLDFCPGTCSSNVWFLGRAGSTGLFVMNSDLDRDTALLWRSDGTRAGTYPLAGPGGPLRPCSYTAVASTGPTLFFTGPAVDGCGLWKTDGTSAGTLLLRQLTSHEYDSLGRMTAVGQRVFFVVSTYDEALGALVSALWVSDGTAGGTLQLREWTSFNNSLTLTAVGSRLFFIAPDSTPQGEGEELWTSDGTLAGTQPLTRFTPVSPFVSRSQNGTDWTVQAVDGQLCFLANDGVTGREVWCSDGTRAGTRRVTDFTVVSPFLVLESWRIEKLGQRLVFPANNGTSGHRLWTTTGQPGSTAPITSCPGGCPEMAPLRAELLRVGSRVIFQGSREGSELWSSDGTGPGTRRLYSCRGDCSITSRSPLLGRLFFTVKDSSGVASFWATDGSEQGTRKLADMGYVYDEGIPHRPAAVGDRGLFPLAGGSSDGSQLWVSDGTPEGTAQVTRIGRNGWSSEPGELVPTRSGGVRFLASADNDKGLWTSQGTEETTLPVAPGFQADFLVDFGDLTLGWGYDVLWRSDGTPGGTFPLMPYGYGDVESAVSLPSRAVFVVRRFEAPYHEVWSTDGTVAGTLKIFDMPAEFSFLHSLKALNDRAFFVTTRSNQDDELWETDGTAAGTRRLTTREHLSIPDPLRLVRLGTTVYFVGADDNQGDELWRADGTSGGTRAVAEDKAQGYADIGTHQGSIYFIANNAQPPYGRGLWKSDGTDAGTVLLAELPRSGTSFNPPQQFTSVGPYLYFVYEINLWRTDGSPSGTLPVLSAESAGAAPMPRHLTALGGRLYFAAADQVHGREIWESDGTVAGTRPVQDIAPGALSSHPEELVASGGKIFFTADDGVHGREPWVYVPSGNGCVPSARALCLGGRFRVEADWRDFTGGNGRGTAVALTGDTGTFWFFDPANVEVILKVLDGQGLNGHHWVFYGALSSVEYTLTVTDTQTGAVRRYINPPGVLGSVADTQAFGPLGAHLPEVVTTGPAPVASSSPRMGIRKAVTEGSCAPTSTRLCLNDGRFAVEARWKDFAGNTGTGKAVVLAGGDTGYFWFFGEDNVEVVLKVLDGRPLNGKFWVFYGALSSVEYTLTVTDTVTGTVKTYTNPSGRLASVADTGAF